MKLAKYVLKLGNVLYNLVNHKYVVLEDKNHPLLKVYSKEFSFEDFVGYEGDIKWLINNSFIECNEKFYNKWVFDFINDDSLQLAILPAGFNCNFRCKYCYQSHKSDFMSEEDIKNIISLMSKYKKVQLDFFGGEPLLNKKAIFKLISSKENLFATITTNGYLLDFDTFEKLVDNGVKLFQITIDGNKTLHDFLRPLANGKGSFDKIISNLELMSQSKKEFLIILRINYNESFNIDEFLDFIESRKFFKDKRFTYIFRPIISGWNDSYNYVYCKLNKSVRFDFYEKILSKGLIPYDYILLSTQNKIFCPSAKKNYFVVLPNSKLKKCTVALDFEKNDVGEIVDGEIVLNKNHSLWIDNKTYLKNECKECSLFTLCGGRVCPLEKVKNDNIKCIDFKDIKEKVVSELVKFREKRR
jgi:uncharacterized protein